MNAWLKIRDADNTVLRTQINKTMQKYIENFAMIPSIYTGAKICNMCDNTAMYITNDYYTCKYCVDSRKLKETMYNDYRVNLQIILFNNIEYSRKCLTHYLIYNDIHGIFRSLFRIRSCEICNNNACRDVKSINLCDNCCRNINRELPIEKKNTIAKKLLIAQFELVNDITTVIFATMFALYELPLK
jgi:hypothetical protein